MLRWKKPRRVKIYYWNGERNFGDALTGLLLRKFTGLTTERVEAWDAELVMVGSILHHLPRDWKGVIAGCGKLHQRTVVDFPNARILALRGPLTAQNSKSTSGKIVMADPGLLADELVGPQDRKYELGLVPHWSDTELERNPLFLQYNPKIIRVSDDPLKVIREIGQCKKIVSSSLHGIIVADAFGIPRRIELAPQMISNIQHEGGTFKFEDYCASIGMKLTVGLTQAADRNTITERQHELFDVFREIKKIFA